MRLRWAKLTMLGGMVLGMVGLVAIFGAPYYADREIVRRAKLPAGLPAEDVSVLRTDHLEACRWSGLALVLVGAALLASGSHGALMSLPRAKGKAKSD